MNLPEKNVLALLDKGILSLQGFKLLPTKDYIPIGFRPIEKAFPHAQFPVGCVHEFLTLSLEDASATNGFVAGLLSSRMQRGGACLWISTSRTLFPAALNRYGIAPHQLVFIDLKKERDVLYATEEALKCNKPVAVFSKLKNISLKESRRMQLAAEKSRVTCFLLHHQPQHANTIAAVSRWHITPLASAFYAMVCRGWAIPDGMWSC